MRRPIGSESVSASGGTMRLVGRRGEGWQQVADVALPLDDALVRLHDSPSIRAARARSGRTSGEG
ncbi:hypothetical protein [Microbacterium sp. ZW T5_56]|uniref:hypothetical protein n=1 Tax=Microbacterium sp. ZW T5_56 TaxID=3378081 RepID=UPI0038545D84